MTKKTIFKFKAIICFCMFSACLATFAGAAFLTPAIAQTDKILVAGNPPLKQSHVDHLRDFFEWLFEKEFSAAQRTEFQSLIAEKWRSEEKAPAGILDLLKTHDGIQALNDADREEIRRQLLPKMLDSFRNSEGTELNRFLSGVYENRAENPSVRNDADGENAKNGSDSADGKSPSDDRGSASFGDLVGTWRTGSVSTIRYKDLMTGNLSDVSGNMSEYEISPNGSIQYTGFLSTTIYACTTKLFFIKTGKISVSGSTVTFDYRTGERNYQNSCNASLSGIKPIPPATKTARFTLERDENGISLCTLEDDGVKSCLRKVS